VTLTTGSDHLKIFRSVLLATSSNAFLSHQISTSQPAVFFSQSKLAPPTASHSQLNRANLAIPIMFCQFILVGQTFL